MMINDGFDDSTLMLNHCKIMILMLLYHGACLDDAKLMVHDGS